MSENGAPWGEDQWSRVRAAVHDEAMRARVAGSFLPLYGPLDETAETVPTNRLHESSSDGATPMLRVDDHETLRLCTVSVNVEVKSRQAADPELESALILFRRAAAIVARVEDALVFAGQPAADRGPPPETLRGLAPVYKVSGGGAYLGLEEHARPLDAEASVADGAAVFTAVTRAIGQLEAQGHYGPFACVLGTTLFDRVNTPIKASMVLPRDSIAPYLGGPLLRSSVVCPEAGLVVALQGEPVEIVVGKDISVRFLQTTPDASHLFRVSERFVLRVKDPRALVRLGEPRKA